MIRRSLVLAICWAAPAIAQEPSSPVVRATGAALERCLAAERGAPPTEQERAALGTLATGVTPKLQAGLGTACTGAACAERIAALSCDALAEKLSAGADPVIPPPATPPADWALAWSRAIAGKVMGCYAAEVGTPLEAAQRAQVDALGHTLAGALTAATARCRVDEDALAACRASIEARSCGAVAASLDPARAPEPTAAPAGGEARPTALEGLDLPTPSRGPLPEVP